MSHQHLHMNNWMAVGSSQRKTHTEQKHVKPPKADAYKTVMCQAWLESKVCSFAENCRFAHGEAELRLSKIAPKQNGKYKTKLCDKYTTTGLCPYGSRCLFIHPDNGNDAYIRPDKILEVTQRHALADMSTQNSASGWPMDPIKLMPAKKEEEEPQLDIKGLFGCFEPATTPNRVSLASGLSGYVSGISSPFSTVSSSSMMNLNTTMDDEFFERDFFRITGLEHLAEELTRNLTTTDLW